MRGAKAKRCVRRLRDRMKCEVTCESGRTYELMRSTVQLFNEQLTMIQSGRALLRARVRPGPSTPAEPIETSQLVARLPWCPSGVRADPPPPRLSQRPHRR